MTLIIFTAMAAMAAAALEASGVMPGVAALIATSIIATQIIKRAVNAIEVGWLSRILVQKAGAVILAVITAVGVVAFYAIKNQVPFDFDLIMTAGQVVIGSPLLKKIFKGKNGR